MTLGLAQWVARITRKIRIGVNDFGHRLMLAT